MELEVYQAAIFEISRLSWRDARNRAEGNEEVESFSDARRAKAVKATAQRLSWLHFGKSKFKSHSAEIVGEALLILESITSSWMPVVLLTY